MQHPAGNEILSIPELSKFRFAKPDDVRRIEREQQELSWALEGRSQFDGERLFGDQLPERLRGGSAPDQDHVRTLLAKNKTTLEASRPPGDLTPIQRNKYAQLERELRADIQEGMLSNTMTNEPTEYNVDMELAWQHYKANKAIAWMNVRQMLDPTNDSPFFTSIEALRPTTPPSVDLRKLRMNWDNIVFTNAQERASAHIDDSVYVQFLRLKALDWSDKGIMRELGLTRAGLEVAMAKLLAERVEQREPEPIDDDDFPHMSFSAPMGETPEPGEDEEPGETPVSPEEDEEGEEVFEEDAVPAGHTNGTGHMDASMAIVPGGRHKTTAQKATWLRKQMEYRHITVTTLGRAMGLRGKVASTFNVRVSKGQRITDEEWQQIGMVLAYCDDDPEWIKTYETSPHAWKMRQMSAKEGALSRPEDD